MSATDPAEVQLLVATDHREILSGPTEPAALDRPPRHPVRQGLGHSLVANRKALTGMIILALFVAVALLAPLLAPGDPSTITSIGAQPPSAEHLFGTTAKGQDVLALTMWGARSSLLVGFVVGIATRVPSAIAMWLKPGAGCSSGGLTSSRAICAS